MPNPYSNINAPPFDLLNDIVGSQTAFDIKFLPIALRLIEKFGKLAVFSTCPQQGFDPARGEATGLDPLHYIQKIIPPFAYEMKYIDGDIIQVGDLQTGIAASGLEFVPAKGMSITFDRQVFKIMNVKSIYSGEQIALFLLQLRK